MWIRPEQIAVKNRSGEKKKIYIYWERGGKRTTITLNRINLIVNYNTEREGERKKERERWREREGGNEENWKNDKKKNGREKVDKY